MFVYLNIITFSFLDYLAQFNVNFILGRNLTIAVPREKGEKSY